jgi:hypothetical protein
MSTSRHIERCLAHADPFAPANRSTRKTTNALAKALARDRGGVEGAQRLGV